MIKAKKANKGKPDIHLYAVGFFSFFFFGLLSLFFLPLFFPLVLSCFSFLRWLDDRDLRTCKQLVEKSENTSEKKQTKTKKQSETKAEKQRTNTEKKERTWLILLFFFAFFLFFLILGLDWVLPLLFFCYMWCCFFYVQSLLFYRFLP